MPANSKSKRAAKSPQTAEPAEPTEPTAPVALPDPDVPPGADTPASYPKGREGFLQLLEETANVSKACELTAYPRRTAYEHRMRDPEFAKAWEAALETGTDALEDEAIRRAYQGISKAVYYGGKLVGYAREYSDTLLIFMLKARRPERFKDRHEIRQDVNVTHHSEPISETRKLLVELFGRQDQSGTKKPLPN